MHIFIVSNKWNGVSIRNRPFFAEGVWSHLVCWVPGVGGLGALLCGPGVCFPPRLSWVSLSSPRVSGIPSGVVLCSTLDLSGRTSHTQTLKWHRQADNNITDDDIVKPTISYGQAMLQRGTCVLPLAKLRGGCSNPLRYPRWLAPGTLLSGTTLDIRASVYHQH